MLRSVGTVRVPGEFEAFIDPAGNAADHQLHWPAQPREAHGFAQSGEW